MERVVKFGKYMIDLDKVDVIDCYEGKVEIEYYTGRKISVSGKKVDCDYLKKKWMIWLKYKNRRIFD